MERPVFLLHSVIVCFPLSFFSSFPSLTLFLVYQVAHYKNVFTLKMSCWPALSVLLLAIPHNHTGSVSVSRQIEWASLSLWLCAVLTDRCASQLIPSLVFVDFVECLVLMDTPIGCFPLCPIKAVLRLGTGCRSQAVQSDQSHCPQNQYTSPTHPASPFTIFLQQWTKFSCMS